MSLPLFAKTVTQLNGSYEMEIEIGSRTFIDKLQLAGVDGPIGLKEFSGKVTGEITVPGLFTAPLTGTAKCSSETTSCQIKFEITATEGGQQFLVRYEAEISGQDYQNAVSGNELPQLRGTAFLEDGRVLGNFSAKMKRP